jgi:hypothetical protein
MQDGTPVLGWDELDVLELGELAWSAFSICPFAQIILAVYLRNDLDVDLHISVNPLARLV